MKIVCIHNLESGKDSYGMPRLKRLPITPQIYEADPDSIASLGGVHFYTLLKDNEEEMITYPSQYFVTLETWREMQLNKLL